MRQSQAIIVNIASDAAIAPRYQDEITIRVAQACESNRAHAISKMIAEINLARGKGIVTRTPEELVDKIERGLAVLALDGEDVIGFMYVAPWTDPKNGQKYVSNSALVVHPDYRGRGLSRAIKAIGDSIVKQRLAGYTPISISMSPHVWKMNASLGYDVQEDFAGLPSGDCPFWKGCAGCPNFEMLKASDYKSCVCKGMIRRLSQAME